jgi:hypothetical protein
MILAVNRYYFVGFEVINGGEYEDGYLMGCSAV